MSFLSEKFREIVSKSKDYKMKVETEPNVSYPTGFLSFDFLNGTVIHTKVKNKDVKYYSVGLVDGSMNMLIGRSGCGKTTFAMQISANIIDKFKTATLYHDDIEGGITEARKAILSRWDRETIKNKYISRNTGITAENFYERLKIISDLKLDNREAFTYDTGLYDLEGNKIFKLEPTIYILDSLSLLMPEKLTEEEKLSGQMSTTATAKTNASIFRRITPLLKASNIILIIINHINKKIEINSFVHTKSQVSYLKQDETLPGGVVPIYLSNNIIRFDDSKLTAEKSALGIDGALVDVALVKSRQNKAGKDVTLVFNQNTGFDPDLSLYVLLKKCGRINGGGAYMHLDDRDDKKFRQKDIKNKLCTDPEFNKIFTTAAFECLKDLVYDVQEDNLFANSNVTNNILSEMNSMISC